MKKTITISIVVLLLLLIIAYFNRQNIMAYFFRPTESITTEEKINQNTEQPEVVVQDLNIPWEIVFLPDGDMLITERAGKLIRIKENTKSAIQISGVVHRGEGGLLGLALDPDFKENNFIYVYLTTQTGDILTNQVERYVLNDTSVTDRKIIIKDIPAAGNHDGGRIAFGPDNMLYVTTGDAGNEESAQDTNSLAGKILRINSDGSIPTDNPFKNAVYSYGHRNIQGIVWDDTRQLWATEHGRSGAQTGYDELNKISKGSNYGWPDVEGDENKTGTIPPQIHSGNKETWAPAGMEYVNGHVLFTGLRGESIYTADIRSGKALDLKKYLTQEYGRLRAIKLGPDGMLYVLTNNKDGRGKPKAGDDKIIKINPSLFGL